MPDTILRVINISKKFSDNLVLDNINLDIKSGEIFGIIGLSGSGKTTLLNTIIGFLEPDMGDIRFKLEHLLDYGEDKPQFMSVFKNRADAKRSFGFAAQDPSFYQQLTSKENLEYFGKLYNISKDILRTNIDILLKLMGLYGFQDILAKNLSGGMQKRLDIACALIHDPKILILDEPTSDLDPILRKQMWGLIKEINRKGTTIILSSHFLDEIEILCNRVGILYKGKIIISGTPDEIKNYYSKDVEIKIETTPGNYSKIIKAIHATNKKDSLGIEKAEISDNKIIVFTKKPEKSLYRVLNIIDSNNEKLVDLDLDKPSLSEVLQSITKKD